MENENRKNKQDATQQLKLIRQELKDPLRNFNIAFALMTVLPFLVFVYLLAAKLFTLDILVGEVGLVLFCLIIISLGGFYIGYRAIKGLLQRVIFYAAQAKHSDKIKSNFVAIVSHEFKNPISIVKLGLTNLRDFFSGHLTDQLHKSVEVSLGALNRMQRLVNDLLDINKIESGVFQIETRLCNLVDLTERQTAELHPVLEEKKIQLKKEIGNKDISLWVDEDKIIRVINNLLSNAIKHTPEGGTITLKVYPETNSARLEVIDSGPGIYPDELKTIFEKFERLNLNKEGTGLGLPICKDIVEMHEGKIWVESKLCEGSKFVVTLPRQLGEKKPGLRQATPRFTD